MDPLATSCVYLTQEFSNAEDNERMQLIAELFFSKMSTITMISIAVLVSGIVFLNVTGIIICKYRKICCF